MPVTPAEAAEAIRACLSDDLRRGYWRGNADPLAGHCYVASEAALALLGDEWKPEGVYVEVGDHEVSHWYLRHRETGEVLDVTADQFDEKPDYTSGRGRGFLTKTPSARARELLRRIEEMS